MFLDCEQTGRSLNRAPMGVFNFKFDDRLDDRLDDRFEESPLYLFIGSLTMGELRAYDGFGRGIRSQAKAPGSACQWRRGAYGAVLHPHALSLTDRDSVKEMYASRAPIAR